jgi:hypothetical protein
MNRSKLVKGLCLTILVGLSGGGLVYAKGASSETPMSHGDPVTPQNSELKGLKSPHSSRKSAAKRLKVVHQQEHEQKMHDLEKAHKGQGHAGDAE